MYKLIFGLFFALLLCYLINNLVNSNIEALGNRLSSNDIDKCINQESSLSYDEYRSFDMYITGNKINYDLIDYNIDTINRQFQEIKNRFNNFKFKLGEPSTSQFSNIEPEISIGGSYPSNIIINFTFPTPIEGDRGDKGEQGEKGPDGNQGEKGNTGTTGYYNRLIA